MFTVWIYISAPPKENIFAVVQSSPLLLKKGFASFMQLSFSVSDMTVL